MKNTAGTDSVLAMYIQDGDVPVLQMNSHKIAGVLDPAADQDAATKKYVDDNVGTFSCSVDATELAEGTVYQNLSGGIIFVSFVCNASASAAILKIGSTSSPDIYIAAHQSADDKTTVSAIVPNNWYYVLTTSDGATIWSSARITITIV